MKKPNKILMYLFPGLYLRNKEVVILDDNELSLLLYSEEYPENWKEICESLKNNKSFTTQLNTNLTKTHDLHEKSTAQK